jgi:dihydrofolate reductase
MSQVRRAVERPVPSGEKREKRMRRLILKMSVSIDGFVGGPSGEIDWMFKSMDESATAWIVDTLWRAGVHVMGSRTFHDMAAYWPSSTEAFAAPMNEIPKVVFSRSGLEAPAAPETAGSTGTTRALGDASRIRPTSKPALLPTDWANPTVASGDLADEIARLKAEDGKDILAHGGASFAQSLAQLNLIDEYRLVVHPVVLGRGLSLFGGLTAPLDMKLESTTVFASGVIAKVYRPA